jgi:hypothetical protein
MDPTVPAQALNALTPILQYGFAGFSLLLLGVIVWLVRQLINVLRANNRALDRLTAALVTVTRDTNETRGEVRELREELMKRTCMVTMSRPQIVSVGTPALAR